VGVGVGVCVFDLLSSSINPLYVWTSACTHTHTHTHTHTLKQSPVAGEDSSVLTLYFWIKGFLCPLSFDFDSFYHLFVFIKNIYLN